MGDEHQIAFKSCLERSNCSEKGPGDPWLAPFFSTKSEAGDHWEVSAILHLGIPWKMGPFCMPFWHFEFEETPSPAEFMRTIHLGLAIDSVRWICWLRKGNTLSDRMLSSSGSSRRPARDAICICPQFCGDLRITKMPSRLRACPRLWKRSLRNLQECSHFKDHHRICSNLNCETQRSDKDTN